MAEISMKNVSEEVASILTATYNYLMKDDKSKPFDIGETSDGRHTFNELYHHKVVLFSVICNTFPHLAWKTDKHYDGRIYDGIFVVGIKTPKGQASYRYDKDKYWDLFNIPIYSNAPKYDGHTPEQAIERLSSLNLESVKVPEWPKIFGL